MYCPLYGVYPISEMTHAAFFSGSSFTLRWRFSPLPVRETGVRGRRHLSEQTHEDLLDVSLEAAVIEGG